MAVNNIVKSLQDTMRKDPGVSGDAQRLEQMVWLFFLKIYDSQENTWEWKDDNFKSIIPEEYRWRNWAPNKDSEGRIINSALTGDALLRFINEGLFPAMKSIQITRDTPRGQAVIKEVFQDLNQYMKDGTLLRQMINDIDQIDFEDAEDRHLFGDLYEGILKDLQGAGHAGEFYTPRALTEFIIDRLNPQLGEVVGDFTSGTGGFLVSALNHLRPQRRDAADEVKFQNSIVGQEWKPFPYLLSITNLFVHDIDAPNIYHCDSLGKNVRDFEEDDKVDVVAMNPPYGGSTAASVKSNFPSEMQTSETADLFLVLIMYRLKRNGRAGVIIPDGFLFGTDGAKLAIKTKMLKEFNLHTIIRLPGSIFAPYTSIATNILFFNNEKADGAPSGYATKETWFYRLDMPEGYKHFSKTKPMKFEHCKPILDWWDDRKEIITDDDEKSRCFSVKELIDSSCNFDVCKFPKDEEEVLPPDELLRDYWQERTRLEAKIDDNLAEIQKLLGIEI